MSNPQPLVMYGPSGGNDASWIQDKANRLAAGGGGALCRHQTRRSTT
jgi:hypothetical protein